ncbi:DNA repair protein RecN [Ammoniphilus resinae]|uniref:DNA repair protein RecN n=1 Tax=Ammoniphilus resinae TaxID=861532 RepID=A0ABS4GVB7_9BACL|nr:DNA repair protein RecN [Ammoniphilus resinae]MBP1934196.1 DNA repair protein RecN (Recombination protein N) [Ammoniphilus resinae]
MLLELSIKNLAVIKQAKISFQKGLNILTGETGAGKSILIDALGLLTGARGSTEYIRYGEKKSEIEGLFEIEENHPVLPLLLELGIEVFEDDLLILRREITSAGKSICRINGQLVPMAVLKEIGPWLVHMHGQHDHQLLMHADRHLSWLDAFAGRELAQVKKDYQKFYNEYQTVQAEYEKLSQNEKYLAQRQDMLSFQLQEISEANLQLHEDEELNAEKIRLSNSERLFKGIDDAYQALTAEHASLDWAGLALSHLETVSTYDEKIGEMAGALETAFYQIEDLARSLRAYREQTEFEPHRLEHIETRLAEIKRLQRKYGKDIEEILEYASAIEEELEMIENREQKLEELMKKRHELAQDLALEAMELSRRRQQTAGELAGKIEAQLKDLQMEKVRFSIEVKMVEDEDGLEVSGQKVRVNDQGVDHVEFLISANPGEPLRPVAKIASGGELSRIMLGMKTILADVEPVETFIFDEVDTGVSGRAAQAIAEKLVAISKQKQILCITHLPQMACMADAHYLISKTATDSETQTKVQLLGSQERTCELARLLGGVEVTDTTRKHAEEMLSLAEQVKGKIRQKTAITVG